MKRVVLIIAVLVSGILTANAQVFVGGGIGVDLTGGKFKIGSNSIDAPSSFTFQITPKVGYYLSDDLSIGLEVGLISSSVTTPKEYLHWGASDDQIVSIIGWQVGAFSRYKFVGTDKLSLLLEGGLAIGGYQSKTKYGSNTTDDDPVSLFTIGVLPVLSYDLSDRLSIEASCDFLRLGFTSNTLKDVDNKDNKMTTTHFGLGLNATNPASDSLGVESPLFRVGLVFKF